MRAKPNASKRISTKRINDLPELTAAMLKRGSFKRDSKALTAKAGMSAFKKAIGRPKSKNPKQLLTLRLEPEIISHWKATGPGWQTRMAERLSHVASR
jgi:uncharacterized protein (DUF4415 family)